MVDWLENGTLDDLRPILFAAGDAGTAVAMATITTAEGGPRPVGTQMVVADGESWGFLSGGCIEADVALHAGEVLASGLPRSLVYGRGSPFIDMRLPCGGRIELLVERILPGDPAVTRLRHFFETRKVATWTSDGYRRSCGSEMEADNDFLPLARRIYNPQQRLAVVGSDPFALAMANMGATMGWDTILIAPFGPSSSPPFGLRCDRRSAPVAIDALRPDPWTAIAVATHDPDLDQQAIVAALESDAGYVGVLGSRRRLPARLAALRVAGAHQAALDRLHAPIGLTIGARSPWEVAAAVTAEIIASLGDRAPQLHPANMPKGVRFAG